MTKREGEQAEARHPARHAKMKQMRLTARQEREYQAALSEESRRLLEAGLEDFKEGRVVRVGEGEVEPFTMEDRDAMADFERGVGLVWRIGRGQAQARRAAGEVAMEKARAKRRER